MKLNQKIVKAINEGIRKSLISFDDIQFDKSRSNNINHKVTKSIEDWKFIHENFVDLGLPSGTLWCKWNLGATNGDTPESWYGHYYMWGSTTPNDDDYCGWKNTPFNNMDNKYDKEYFEKHMYKFIDRDGNLLSTYDAAYLTNDLMHMPSTLQIQELDKETEHHLVDDYNGIDGLNGLLFTGKNGNMLFIPAAGYRHGSISFYGSGSICYLWSNSLNFNTSYRAYRLYFNDSDFYSFSDDTRFLGLSIRGVIKTK